MEFNKGFGETKAKAIIVIEGSFKNDLLRYLVFNMFRLHRNELMVFKPT